MYHSSPCSHFHYAVSAGRRYDCVHFSPLHRIGGPPIRWGFPGEGANELSKSSVSAARRYRFLVFFVDAGLPMSIR